MVFIAEQRVGGPDLQHLSGPEGRLDSVEEGWPHILNLINSLFYVFSLGADGAAFECAACEPQTGITWDFSSFKTKLREKCFMSKKKEKKKRQIRHDSDVSLTTCFSLFLPHILVGWVVGFLSCHQKRLKRYESKWRGGQWRPLPVTGCSLLQVRIYIREWKTECRKISWKYLVGLQSLSSIHINVKNKHMYVAYYVYLYRICFKTGMTNFNGLLWVWISI